MLVPLAEVEFRQVGAQPEATAALISFPQHAALLADTRHHLCTLSKVRNAGLETKSWVVSSEVFSVSARNWYATMLNGTKRCVTL